MKAVVHGDADYQLIANGTESPSNMHVATADQRFTRTSANGGAYNWTRLSIPFVNNGPCTDVRYILFMATTNESPGTGSTNDDLFLDDVLLVYNPTLSMGQLASTSFTPGDAITIPFSLSGTMSPENLNASANQVIAQLSNANGSFSNPTELGHVTTNTSGSISAQIPNVADGQYQIRVISTNYPMIGQNIQTVSISSPTYTITLAANPSEGGTVAGGGTYNQGASCTLTATANAGYTFVNWTKNGFQVSTEASYTFTVTESEEYVAHFLSTEGLEERLTTCQIYPNPFASKVNIMAEKVVKSVSVYDVFGRLVKEQKVFDTVIDLDLSDLNDGTYLLQLNYGDSSSAHRIVKMAR